LIGGKNKEKNNEYKNELKEMQMDEASVCG
jgi:hypothetical protein